MLSGEVSQSNVTSPEYDNPRFDGYWGSASWERAVRWSSLGLTDGLINVTGYFRKIR